MLPLVDNKVSKVQAFEASTFLLVKLFNAD